MLVTAAMMRTFGSLFGGPFLWYRIDPFFLSFLHSTFDLRLPWIKPPVTSWWFLCFHTVWVPLTRLDERSDLLRRLSLARSPEVRLKSPAAFLKSQLLLGGPGTPTDYVNQHQF